MRSAIVTRPIEPAALLTEVASHAHGATALFVGTVRAMHGGREVTGMEYASYPAMAERELAAIVLEAAARHDGTEVVAEHRVGVLALGDVSVVIAAAHAHRAPAFDAARYVIEEIKRRVPIWKLEHYVDGTREWVHPVESREAGAENAFVELSTLDSRLSTRTEAAR